MDVTSIHMGYQEDARYAKFALELRANLTLDTLERLA